MATSASTSPSRLRAIMAHPEARRVFFFLLMGGMCALFNLGVVAVFTKPLKWEYLPALLVATESSVVLGFILNDRVTFRMLAAHAGGWGERCLRYHGAAAAGQALVIGLGLILHYIVGLPGLVGQAISLAFVTVLNFLVQRFLTYNARHQHPEADSAATSQLTYTVDQQQPAEQPATIPQPVSMYAWARMRSLPHD
jgi:putative flippase GtrA